MASKNRRKTGKANRGSFKENDPRINRNGRPPLSEAEREFRDLCRDKSKAALNRLVRLGSRSVRANEAILEHAWGKIQKIEHTGKDGAPLVPTPPEWDLSKLEDAELEQLEALHAKAATGTAKPE